MTRYDEMPRAFRINPSGQRPFCDTSQRCNCSKIRIEKLGFALTINPIQFAHQYYQRLFDFIKFGGRMKKCVLLKAFRAICSGIRDGPHAEVMRQQPRSAPRLFSQRRIVMRPTVPSCFEARFVRHLSMKTMGCAQQVRSNRLLVRRG